MGRDDGKKRQAAQSAGMIAVRNYGAGIIIHPLNPGYLRNFCPFGQCCLHIFHGLIFCNLFYIAPVIIIAIIGEFTFHQLFKHPIRVSGVQAA